MPSDLAWERAQEKAALALRAGDFVTPPQQWLRALEIAERIFARGNPRFATSLTNHAVALRQPGSVAAAEQAFRDAREIWRTAGAGFT